MNKIRWAFLKTKYYKTPHYRTEKHCELLVYNYLTLKGKSTVKEKLINRTPDFKKAESIPKWD